MTVTELAEAQKARRLDVQRTLHLADAFVHQVDHGAGKPLTLTEATAATADLFAAVKRADLPAVVAYLACRVAGYRRSENADARLALVQIESIVTGWREQHTPKTRPTSSSITTDVPVVTIELPGTEPADAE